MSQAYLPQAKLLVEVRKMSYTQLSLQDTENICPYAEGNVATDFILITTLGVRFSEEEGTSNK